MTTASDNLVPEIHSQGTCVTAETSCLAQFLKLPSRSATPFNRSLREEGVTLVEIMIVVVIMALIATAASIAIIPQINKARIGKAESDLGTIRQAAMLYAVQVGGDCPTVQDLADEGTLDSSQDSVDPWGNDYLISCDGDAIQVSSMGPDKQADTEDDIQ